MATDSNNLLVKLGPQEVTSGIWKQDSPMEIPLWAAGYNVRFTSTGVRKMSGWSSIFTELGSAPVRGMHQFRSSAGVQNLYFGDQTTLYSWNTVSVSSEKTGFTGNLNQTSTTFASVWSIVNFGDFVLATNGVDSPQKDVGAGFVDLGADFTTAEIFIRKGAYVLALNTNLNQRGVYWCDDDDIETWTPTSENTAGDLILRELDSEIIAAVPLGDRIAVYGKDQLFLVSYVGAPFYFGYAPALNGIGAISKQSIVPVGRKNYGFGRQGIFVTDGVSFQFIDDPAIRDYLQDDVSWAQSSKICGFHDEDNHQIIWYYPSTSGSGEPDKGIGFDYVKSVWTLYNFGRTSALSRNTYNYPVLATDGGQVFYHNFGDDADGGALSSELVTKLTSFNGEDLMKTLTAVRVEWSGSGLLYQIGKSADTDTAATYDSAAAVPTGFGEIQTRKTDRYFSLKFSSTGVGDAWEIHGISAYGVVAGRR